jgi:hypothetical protein
MQIWWNCQVVSEQTSDSSAFLNAACLLNYVLNCEQHFHISIQFNCNRISEILTHLYLCINYEPVCGRLVVPAAVFISGPFWGATRVICETDIKVFGAPAVSIYPEDGGNGFLRNIANYRSAPKMTLTKYSSREGTHLSRVCHLASVAGTTQYWMMSSDGTSVLLARRCAVQISSR